MEILLIIMEILPCTYNANFTTINRNFTTNNGNFNTYNANFTAYNGSFTTYILYNANFTTYEQQLFVSSFYCYLNYNKTDFVIDLDDVWKWMEFATKQKAKLLLEAQFVKDTDYIILLNLQVKQSDHTRGGHNKEIFMLNVSTFKKFCLKAGTKKADSIHDYYIKLEGLLHEVVQEESTELKTQLEQNQIQLEQNQLQLEQNQLQLDKSEKTTEKIREKTLLEQFGRNTQCVYYGSIDNLSDNNEKLIKFGNSNFLKNRVTKHKDTYANFSLVNAFRVDNKLQIENAIKDCDFFTQRLRTITLKNKKYVELLSMDDVTFEQLDKVIKEIITNIEYSPENYVKILQENKHLKQQLNIKNENNNLNDVILLTAENKRLKIQNIKLMKQLVSIKKNKKYKDTIVSIQEDDIDIDSNLKNHVNTIQKEDFDNYNYVSTINSLKQNCYNNEVKRNKDGKYYNNEIVYEKLVGSREDVFTSKAYKTTGGLTKLDLMLNHNGKIVSKKKSAHETYIDRFKMHGVNHNNTTL
jgi:hypothetical protein